MTNWITQEGYPIIHVTRVENTNQSTITYKLHQEYFLLSQSKVKKNYKWVIPFTYKFDSDPTDKQIIWLNLTDNEIVVPSSKSKWIFGNLDFMGYYRTNYDINNWKLIIKQLKIDHSFFTSTERAALIYDSFTLARVGLIDYPLALDLSSYLNKETEFVPWKSFFKSITYLDNMLSSSSCYGLFQKYCARQINDIYRTLGWNDKGTFMQRLLRNHVIKYASYFEIEDAVKKARTKFDQYMNGTRNSHDAFIMSSIIESLAVGTNSKDALEKIGKILSNGAGAATNSVEYALDQIKSNIKWMPAIR
ncbi:aminopeptidase N-like [Brachionus plicatilis]|uniref:Aminopeptidase N-like n=1 Tax=Brachionus plicatilis TaxID=10195 RepID=A0A3M7R4N7_BRAPC|nr:aminopeptidase N-like [Brachionus plicatilis]